MNVVVVEDDLFREQACEFLALLEAQRVEIVRYGRRESLKPAEKFSAGEGLLLFLLEALVVAPSPRCSRKPARLVTNGSYKDVLLRFMS